MNKPPHVIISYHELRRKDYQSLNFLFHVYETFIRQFPRRNGENIVMMYESDFDTLIRNQKRDDGHSYDYHRDD